MSCIFASSKYYLQSKVDPLEIAPPLGYTFLNSNKQKKKINIPNTGQLLLKQVFDKSHYKVLSQRKVPADKVGEYLKVSEVPRKTEYLSSTLIEFMRGEYTREIFSHISRLFVPNFKPEYAMIELSQLLKNPRIDSITHIEDFALSKYFYLCEGSTPWRMKYLYQFFNRRIIEYPVQCQLINHLKLQAQQLLLPPAQQTTFEPPKQLPNIDHVKNLIRTINETNRKKDPLYSGIHFYFADYSLYKQTADYFQCEIDHYPLLQYFLTVMTGVLGEGQPAVIRLNGVFKHKTFQFLFMLRLMFGKVTLCKPLGSNPFTPDCYAVCEYYCKNNGDIIHKDLLQNYHLLKQFNDGKLLLDPKKILKQDLHSNLKLFNESLVHKGIQLHVKQFKNNSNIEYYPSRERLLERLPSYAMDLDGIVREMVRLPDKPTEEEIREAKNQQNRLKAQNVTRPTGITTTGLFSRKINPSTTTTSTQKDKPIN